MAINDSFLVTFPTVQCIKIQRTMCLDNISTEKTEQKLSHAEKIRDFLALTRFSRFKMEKSRFLKNGSIHDLGQYIPKEPIPWANFWYRSRISAFFSETLNPYEGGVIPNRQNTFQNSVSVF